MWSHFPLDYIVFVRKILIIFIFVPLNVMSSSLSAFKTIPFANGFQQFDYDVPWDGFLCVFPLGFSKFLRSLVYRLPQVWGMFYSISSISCLPPFPNSHDPWKTTRCWPTLHWDSVHFSFCTVFLCFVFCFYFWIVSIATSSSSLTFYPSVFNLILIPSSEF